MSPHLYELSSTWRLPATVDEVWAVVTDLGLRAGPHPWWPGCTLAAPLSSDPSATLRTTTAHLEFRSGLGYRLRISVHPRVVVAPHRLDVEASGDLEGAGRLRLTPGNEGLGTRMDIDWRVRPTRRWMVLLSPLFAPLFTTAHARVMRQGERGLVGLLRGRAGISPGREPQGR